MKISNEIGYSILIPISESLGALALRGRHGEDQRIVGLFGFCLWISGTFFQPNIYVLIQWRSKQNKG